MRIAQIAFGITLALGMVACSRTSMPLSRDAAVEANRAFDAVGDTGTVPAFLDTGPLPPDSAVVVPDAIALAPDSGMLDTAPRTPDTGIIIGDFDSAAFAGDTAIPALDSAAVPPDTDRPTADSNETAPNPYADRTFRIDPQNPAPTPDPSCTQFGPADYIQMTFSSDLTTLTVLDVRDSATMTFHATVGPESSRLTYHVTDFLAGGVITFEGDQGVYVAEVVLYGSGVPIVQCLRGALTPQP